MRKFFFATIITLGLVGCYTDQVAPKAAQLSPTSTSSATASVAPSSTPAAATPTIAPSSTEIGDMTSDVASHTIVIDNYVRVKSDLLANGWTAEKVFAGLGDGTVRSYVAGGPLEIVGAVGPGKGWSDAPQDEKYLGGLKSGKLVTPLPSANSDSNGSNIAFAAKESGTWKWVGYSSSSGPKNYASVYLFGEGPYALTKFKWADWKLLTK